MEQYQVLWKATAHDRERSVQYSHYSQAEACFIGLFSCVDRRAGGWAELRDGAGVIVRLS